MKRFFIGLSVLFILGCATGELVRKEVRPGMSKAEVINVLGNPDGFKTVEGQEILTYKNRLISGWSWDRADYHIVIKNGEVIAYGAGEVRVKDNNTILIVPLN